MPAYPDHASISRPCQHNQNHASISRTMPAQPDHASTTTTCQHSHNVPAQPQRASTTTTCQHSHNVPAQPDHASTTTTCQHNQSPFASMTNSSAREDGISPQHPRTTTVPASTSKYKSRKKGGRSSVVDCQNSNLKTLGSIPWWGRVRNSFFLLSLQSQLLCRLVCA